MKLGVALLRSILLLLLIATMAGCGSTVSKGVKVTDADLARYDSMSADEMFSYYEGLLVKAEQMKRLAPHYHEEADGLLKQARDDFKRYEKKERVAQFLAKGEGILQKGHGVVQKVQNRLEKELALNDSLLQLKANKSFPSEYKNVKEQLSGLIEKIELEEDGELAAKQKDLLKNMRTLEVKAIKYNALHEAKKIIQQAESGDAEKFAAKTFAEAKQVYQQADNAIQRQPYDKDLVAQHSAKALFAAKHVKYVLAEVVKLEQQFKQSMESVVLAEELRLKQVADALKTDDVRDRPLAQQASALAGMATEFLRANAEQQQLSTQLKDQKEENQELQQQLQEAKAANELLKQKSADQDKQILGLSAQLVQLNEKLKLEQQSGDSTLETAPQQPEPITAPESEKVPDSSKPSTPSEQEAEASVAQ